MSVAALVLAAGRGKRLGGATPKAFVSIAGRPLVVHACEALAASGVVDRLVPVVAESDLAAMDAIGRRVTDRLDDNPVLWKF